MQVVCTCGLVADVVVTGDVFNANASKAIETHCPRFKAAMDNDEPKDGVADCQELTRSIEAERDERAA